MRKILWALMSLMFLSTSCSNEEEPDVNPQAPIGKVANHFYGVKAPSGINTKGVAQKDKLWYNGVTVKVKFLNGSEAYKQKVKAYATEWEQYANIKFNFVENSEKAQVRIGFDWNEQRYITWSYIGTDCKSVTNQGEATMNFAYWDSSNEEEIKGDVLRAFGQVLGLELEHRHLEFDPGWTNQISDYWEGEIEDATWEDLQEYVFDPLETSNVIQTQEYDENSIMIWPFSKKYAKNTARDFNYELSNMDIEFIKQLYPKDEIEGDLLILMTNVKGDISFEWKCAERRNITVDWGDGVTQTYANNSEDTIAYKRLSHEYENNNELYEIKLLGENDALLDFSLLTYTLQVDRFYMANCTVIGSLKLGLNNYTSTSGRNVTLKEIELSNNPKLRDLVCGESHVSQISISECPSLWEINCTRNQLASIDLSDVPALGVLYLTDNELKHLDVSSNTKLEILYCDYNRLTALEVVHNPYLRWIHCGYNKIEMLDIAQNKELAKLGCNNNLLTGLNLSNNPKLNSLSCSYNQLSQLEVSENEKMRYLICNNNLLTSLVVNSTTKEAEIDGGGYVFASDNPFVLDDNALYQFCLSLPLFKRRDAQSAISSVRLGISANEMPSNCRNTCYARHWMIE